VPGETIVAQSITHRSFKWR
jgi:hypothetical protein